MWILQTKDKYKNKIKITFLDFHTKMLNDDSRMLSCDWLFVLNILAAFFPKKSLRKKNTLKWM